MEGDRVATFWCVLAVPHAVQRERLLTDTTVLRVPRRTSITRTLRRITEHCRAKYENENESVARVAPIARVARQLPEFSSQRHDRHARRN